MRIASRVLLGVLAAFSLLGSASPAQAVTWCHDYSWFRATLWSKGKGESVDNLSPGALASRLTGLGYKRAFTLKPGAVDGKPLQPGDVVIIGVASEGQEEDHSGFVGTGGLIDHLIQRFGESGRSYKPQELAEQYDTKLASPLVRTGWSVEDLRTRTRVVDGKEYPNPYRNKTFQVWRKDDALFDEVGVWLLDGSRIKPFEAAIDLGTPKSTIVSSVLEKGVLDYTRKPASGEGPPYPVSIRYSPPPRVIIEGDSLRLWADMSHKAPDEFGDDRFSFELTGNALRAALPVAHLSCSLKDPKYGTYRVQKGGVWIDVPPEKPKDELVVLWPAFDPADGIRYRTIKLLTQRVRAINYRYDRRVMQRGDALKLLRAQQQ